MALFLNTPKLNYWIPKLIEESEEELILIVPYIQTSENVLKALNKADSNGVEITLVYRENKLSDYEKSKLLALKNINLLHHPNVHCKCYYNGDLLIVGSMNLYEYSEKNNREMGMLMHRCDIDGDEKGFKIYNDDKEVFDDGIQEIREIINGASLEKSNDKARERSFEIDIIKTEEDLARDLCDRLNKSFLNKKFKPFEINDKVWFAKCDNYFDKVDVIFEYKRIAIKFKLDQEELIKVYNAWVNVYDEYEFAGFKYYWNDPYQELLLYRDFNFDWSDDNIKDKKYYEGISSIIEKYRKLSNK
ncbi:phospholipase D-like domain-containing protein [Algibacter lectus]|uniref:Phospholipase D-like protein n=1 Tax=Algibacter lectus TaxID=221126 RepID=A0A4V6QDC9_9FLAO|nr:phospholipase D-like domain-containing protein [Algibacter lectus]MWW23151.1 hypothetical protein [Algibacter lectus]TDY64171.1 phospholipase D-like protein [Algibacter lectus]